MRTTTAVALLCLVAVPVATQERTPAPATPPQRIVSVVPAVTEMLYAIGAGDRVVGVSSYDRYPPEVERVTKVGALLDPDVERILSLRPDLVAVYRSQTDLLTQLARARISPFVYAHTGLDDITDTIRQLGDRIGSSGRAGALASDIERRIAAVRTRTAGTTRPRTLIVMGRDAFSLRGIYASGGVGFIHDMVTAAGGENVFADAPRQAVQATSELVIARRPDVILELRAEPLDRATEEREIRTWSAVASVPAVKQRRIHIIGDARTVIPGPRVAEGLELIAAALAPR